MQVAIAEKFAAEMPLLTDNVDPARGAHPADGWLHPGQCQLAT
jgi:hypothetical protein